MVLPIFLLILAAILLFLALRAREKARKILRDGVLYDDLLGSPAPLRSKKLNLAGRPDYILRDGDFLIPVEFKSTNAPRKPYKNHILQLAAYCLLVEENFKVNVPAGILRYGDGKEFKIHFDESLRRELLDTIEEMNRIIESGVEVPKSPSQKCDRCSLRKYC